MLEGEVCNPKKVVGDVIGVVLFKALVESKNKRLIHSTLCIELFLYTTHLSLGLDHLFAIVPVAEKGFHLSPAFNLETLPPSSDSTGFITYDVYEA